MNNKSKAEAILGLVREIDSLENEKQLLQKQLDAVELNGNQNLWLRLGHSDNYAELKLTQSSHGWHSVVRGREMIALGVKKVLQATIDQKIKS